LAVPPHSGITVAHDGTIAIVPQGQGAETLAQVGRIKLVNPDPAMLEKRSDGLIRMAGGAVAEADASVRVASGFIESSNVNVASALVDMIEYARQFEIAVRMMRVADDNEARAAMIARLA